MPRIPSSTPNFENHVTVAVNSALGDLAKNQLKSLEVNARVEIRLDLILKCEPGGNWTVSQAHLIQLNAQAPQKPKPQNSQVLKQPTGPASPITKVWRPKVNKEINPSLLPKLFGAVDIDSTLETSSVSGTPSILTPTFLTEVNDASSSKSPTEPSTDIWAMLLRDRKWLFVQLKPPLPPLPLSINPFFALSSKNLGLESAWSESTMEV